MFRLVIAATVLAGLPAHAGRATQASEASGSVSVEIDPEVFRPVLVPGGSLISRGIRSSEADAYYGVLDHARRVDPDALDRAAARFLASRRDASRNPAIRRLPIEEFPVFVDLYNTVGKPEVYLGKPVSLRGHVRRVLKMPAGENAYGIEELYEVWLFTSDGQQHPVVLVTTSIPAGLLEEVGRLKAANRPVVVNGVSGSGYFFKMYGYPAGDAYRFAPLVLAGRLEWSPPPTGGLDWTLPAVLAVGLVVFGLPIGWFVWKNRREDWQRRASRAASVPDSFEWTDDGSERDAGGTVELDQSDAPAEET
jgi:hypothetical protein